MSRADRPARVRRPLPGGAEAVRAERRAQVGAQSGGDSATLGTEGGHEGRAIIASAWTGTAIFVVATALAAFVPSARIPTVVVDMALLLGGSGLYLWGWAIAAGRSRDDQISLWNLILLEDVAPSPVRVRLLGALALQVIVAAATCWISAGLAFGWLVPVWGLAHCEFWGARYGVFPPRTPAPPKGGAGVGRRTRG